MEYDKLREMGKKIRLVMTDMDGTLLNSDKRVSARTRAVIARMREQGIGFAVCTGRIPTMVEYYLKDLEITIPIVAANGAIVWDPVKGEALYSKSIDPDQAEALMDFCRENHMDYSALTLEASYFSTNSVRIKRFHAYNEISKSNGGREMELKYLDQGHKFLKNHRIYKMLVYELEEGQQKRAEEFMKTLPGITYTSSDAKLWDIAAAGVSKGSGLVEEARVMGLLREQICAFGDFYNDLTLLEEAGLPVAMGNACDQLKRLAAYITKTNDEDGVADAIERLLL